MNLKYVIFGCRKFPAIFLPCILQEHALIVEITILILVQACQSDSRVMAGVTLPMFLITPVQRVPRYILLLKVWVSNVSQSLVIIILLL